jgi:hypothetical protein
MCVAMEFDLIETHVLRAREHAQMFYEFLGKRWHSLSVLQCYTWIIFINTQHTRTCKAFNSAMRFTSVPNARAIRF